MSHDFSIRQKLSFLVVSLLALAALNGGLGLYGMKNSVDGLNTVYNDRVIPMDQVSEIQRMLLENRLSVAVALNASTPSVIQDRAAAVERNIAEINKLWEAYMATYLTPEEKKLAEKFQGDRGRFVQEGLLPALTALRANDIPLASRIVADHIRPLYEPVGQGIQVLMKLQTSVAKEEYDRAAAEYALLRNLSILLLVIGSVAGFLVARSLIAHAVLRPLDMARATASAIARGDLTHSINIHSRDELGQVLEELAHMQTALREVVNRIQDSSTQLSAASEELSATTEQIATATNHQSEAAASMAAAVEEMTVSINQVADHAHDARSIAKHSGEASEKGSEVISHVVSDINHMAETVNETSDTVKELGRTSGEIGVIVKVIRDIAEQTNLLALNAAIEAARAGDQGRGFAVVADEVRKLSERTSQSTEEISRMIEKVMAQTGNAVKTMEHQVHQVHEEVELANQAGAAIQEITKESRQVVGAVNDISSAIKEQSLASNDIAKHVERIAQMSEQNSAAVKETASAARHLEKLAADLAASAQRFRLA